MSEPTSSTHAEACPDSGPDEELAERVAPCLSQHNFSDMDQTEQPASACVVTSPETSAESEESHSDPVSSSCSSSSSSSSNSSSCSIDESVEGDREDVSPTPSSSTNEPPTEGAMESASVDMGTTDEPMEQD